MSSQSWVSARHDCSMPAQFAFVCRAIEDAVNERNKLNERRDIASSAFRFARNDHVFTVTRADHKIVTISISDDTATLEVRGHTDKPLDLAVALGTGQECLLVEIQVDGALAHGASYRTDDIPQVILDRLFFDSGSDVIRRR